MRKINFEILKKYFNFLILQSTDIDIRKISENIVKGFENVSKDLLLLIFPKIFENLETK